jgi:hypothetical protein
MEKVRGAGYVASSEKVREGTGADILEGWD